MSQKTKSPLLKSKLPGLGPTIFSTMSRLAGEHSAINLSQGFPDFDVDPVLIDLVSKYMKSGHNQYAPMAGAQGLRNTLSEINAKKYGHKYDLDSEINITAGATQAISAAIACSIKEGDEVVIFTPAYDCYTPMVELHGGSPVYIQLVHPEYRIDWNQVKSLISHRTKMIIINTPHNPSARVMTSEDIEILADLTSETDIVILSDEVYENIVFDGHKHQSVRASEQLRQRSFVIGSFGKTLHVTGWKIGYCLAPENLMNEFRKVHQYEVFSVNTPMQMAIGEYIQNYDEAQISKMYQAKRDYFLSELKDSRFKPIHSQGSYFQLLDYSEISDEADTDFAIRLTKETGVASIPLSVFYNQPTDHKVLRFCFAKNDETLAQAAERLSQL